MSDDRTGFCSQCGVALGTNTKYCPECGVRVPGRSPEQVAEEKEAIRASLKARLMWSGVFMLIVAIPMLCAGIYRLVDVDSIINLVLNDPYWSQLVANYGMSESEVRSIIENFGYAALASGIFGLIVAATCFMRRFYFVALLACMMSALFGTAGFFGLILGLIVFWMILSSRYGFKEHEAGLDEYLNETIV
jgi:hypothetical protein